MTYKSPPHARRVREAGGGESSGAASTTPPFGHPSLYKEGILMDVLIKEWMGIENNLPLYMNHCGYIPRSLLRAELFPVELGDEQVHS